MQTLNFKPLFNYNMEDENLPVQCHPVIKSKKKKSKETKNDTM